MRATRRDAEHAEYFAARARGGPIHDTSFKPEVVSIFCIRSPRLLPSAIYAFVYPLFVAEVIQRRLRREEVLTVKHGGLTIALHDDEDV